MFTTACITILIHSRIFPGFVLQTGTRKKIHCIRDLLTWCEMYPNKGFEPSDNALYGVAIVILSMLVFLMNMGVNYGHYRQRQSFWRRRSSSDEELQLQATQSQRNLAINDSPQPPARVGSPPETVPPSPPATPPPVTPPPTPPPVTPPPEQPAALPVAQPPKKPQKVRFRLVFIDI